MRFLLYMVFLLYMAMFVTWSCTHICIKSVVPILFLSDVYAHSPISTPSMACSKCSYEWVKNWMLFNNMNYIQMDITTTFSHTIELSTTTWSGGSRTCPLPLANYFSCLFFTFSKKNLFNVNRLMLVGSLLE